jgi:hypothetical protein
MERDLSHMIRNPNFVKPYNLTAWRKQCVLYRTDLYHHLGGERCPIIH